MMGPAKTVRVPVVFAALLIVVAGLISPPGVNAQEVQVTSADPPAAEQGTINLDVTIKGKGFKNGAQAKWFVTGTTNPGGVTVNSTTFISPTELRANITVADDATISTYDIQVSNSNGRSGKGTELFNVVGKGQLTGNCTLDEPVRVIFAPGFVNGGTARLYGDSDFGATANTYYNASDPVFNGGSVYIHGVDGVSAEFQICNGTNDFIFNLGQSNHRIINFDFSEPLTSPDPRAVDVRGKTYQEGFLNMNQVANEALYTNGQLDTCMGSTLYSIIKGQTSHVFFQNPALYESTPSTGVPGCTGGPNIQLANQGGDTSVIQVQHPDACTWVIMPVVDPTWHRGGLVETLKGKGGTVSGGQYNMPFAIKLIKLGCSAGASQ